MVAARRRRCSASSKSSSRASSWSGWRSAAGDHRPDRRLRRRCRSPISSALFALLAFAAVYAGRRYYARNPVASADPNLNERAARLIGRTVTVETAIENGQGRVKVGDGVWNARGPDAPAGSQVVVVSADGSCLNVEPAA